MIDKPDWFKAYEMHTKSGIVYVIHLTESGSGRCSTISWEDAIDSNQFTAEQKEFLLKYLKQ